MTRTAARLLLAVACLSAGWLAGALPRVRAQEERPAPAANRIESIAAGAGGTLYVVQNGEPYQCQMGQVPGTSFMETTTAYVCQPLPLHFR